MVVDSAYHRSPFRFSPINYQNPECRSRSPSGQTILFGCPLELCTVGELKKIPPVLEYLLDCVSEDGGENISEEYPVGDKHRNCSS